MPAGRYIDIHLLQTIPYANLNRDDLGSPKTVQFGGEDRTRVSSQCWKRAVRLAMEDQLGNPAVRTRGVAVNVAHTLMKAGWPEDLATFAGQQVLSAAAGGLRMEADGLTSSVLLYLPKTAIGDLADVCLEHRDALESALAASPADGKTRRQNKQSADVVPAEKVNAVLASRNGIINLFGRMLAELPTAEVDGAVQVAHAFTTHSTAPQVDFFTALDDLNPAEDRGSGHMNSAEFSAGVFYRYASVNLADLVRNTGDPEAARELTAAFLASFITSIPGAKKNSTAPFTVPDLAYIAVRSDRPVSLAAAFESPVRIRGAGGHSEPSRDRLSDYASKVHRLIGADGLAHHGHASVDDKPIEHLGDRAASFRALVDAGVDRAFAQEAAQQ